MTNEMVADEVRAAVSVRTQSHAHVNQTLGFFLAQSKEALDAAAKRIALKAITELKSDDNVSIIIVVVE
jgi:hypothetical protein